VDCDGVERTRCGADDEPGCAGKRSGDARASARDALSAGNGDA